MKYTKVIIGAAVLAALGVAAFLILSEHSGRADKAEQEAGQVLNNNTGEQNKVNGKVLVAYFSRPDENYNVGTVEVGNTELLAKEIVAQTSADEFKIVPVVPYPADYQEAVELATEERNHNARPEYVGKVEDFGQYDTVFIGYPIWWGDLPMVVYKFLEDYDFSGKTVIPFNTHEGSGSAGTYAVIANKLSTANVNTNGLAIAGSTARTDAGREQVREWLEGLGY